MKSIFIVAVVVPVLAYASLFIISLISTSSTLNHVKDHNFFKDIDKVFIFSPRLNQFSDFISSVVTFLFSCIIVANGDFIRAI